MALHQTNVIWEPFPGAQKKFMKCPVWECLLHGNRGGGKCQPLSSAILTPKGWKTMGGMKVGSRICNPDGTTSTVMGIFPQGLIQTYKVELEDGSFTYCSLDHLWQVLYMYKRTLGDPIVLPLEQLIKEIKNNNIYIPTYYREPCVYYHKALKSITLDKIEFCQCIKIDNSNGLYITDNYIITHNTDVLIMDFAQGVGKGYGIDYKGLLLREATTELGDVITKTRKWLPRIFPTAKYNASRKIWTFEDGETLWLNYARTIEDYDQYHGHCKEIHSLVLLPNGESKQAGELKVGDLVQTLSGAKKITRVYKYSKPGVKVSVYDAYSNLIGEQLQGVLHPILTNAGWQRLGLQVLSQTSLQSSSFEPLIKEVQEFLHEIHQDILRISRKILIDPLDSAISKHLPALYSCLCQISVQFSDMKRPILLDSEFPPCVDPEILLELYLLKVQEIFVLEFDNESQSVQQFLYYCDFLQILVLRIRGVHVHLLQSMLCQISCTSFSLKKPIYQSIQQCQSEKLNSSEQLFLLTELKKVQTSWNDTFAYVHHLKHKGQDLQDHYHSEYGSNDDKPLQVLGISRSSFQEQNDDVQFTHFPNNLDDQDNKDLRIPFSVLKNDWVFHPYTHERIQTNFSLKSFSFSVSSHLTPFEMVDFEIQDDNHYITVLNQNNSIKSQKSQKSQDQICLIDQNSYPWIGFEELTNHVFPTVYLKLMSCSRSSNPNITTKYRATCNPSGPGHAWVKQRFIDVVKPGKIHREELDFEFPDENGKMVKQKVSMARTHVQSYMAENKALLEADPTYMAKIYSLTQDDEMLRKAWIDGSWDLLMGGFFTDVWDKDIHVLPTFKVPKSWRLLRSFDWGSSKPWAVTYGFESNGEQPNSGMLNGLKVPYIPRGSVIVPTEIYGWNGNPNEGDRAISSKIAERVLDIDRILLAEYGIRCTPGPADTSIYDVRDGASIGSELEKHNCIWTRAYKGAGSRVAGWSLIRQMLGAAKRGDLESPHLYFFDRAEHHIRTLPQMQRDKVKPEDINSLLEDHCFVYDTEIITDKGIKKIGDLVNTTGKVLTVNGKFTDFYNCRLIQKNANILEITFNDGFMVKCTEDHKFLTSEGFVLARDLLISDTQCIANEINARTSSETLKKDVFYTLDDKRVHVYAKQNDILRIKKIKQGQKENVFCLTAKHTHTFALKNGVLVSNCMDSLRYLLARKLINMKRRKVGI